VNNASASGEVTATSKYAGGLIGDHQSTTPVTGVNASGTVSGTGSIGGLIGRTNISVRNATASGDVNGTTADNKGQVGGLIGELRVDQPTTISDTTATGAVSADNKYVGGLIGNAVGGDTAPINISGARAHGTVTQTDSTIGSVRAGGLVGRLRYGGNVTNVSATGDVTSEGGNRVGGLFGELHHKSASNTVANASATSDVDATTGSNVGGLIGGLHLRKQCRWPRR
jgi:hypothetical protein